MRRMRDRGAEEDETTDGMDDGDGKEAAWGSFPGCSLLKEAE